MAGWRLVGLVGPQNEFLFKSPTYLKWKFRKFGKVRSLRAVFSPWLPTSPTCSAYLIMASVLWAIKRLPRVARPVRSFEKVEGARARSKLSQPFPRSSMALANAFTRVSAQSRRYTTTTRGAEVAKEFEEWINAIPTQQKNVRPFAAFFCQFSSKSLSNRIVIESYYRVEEAKSKNEDKQAQWRGGKRRTTNRSCGGRKGHCLTERGAQSSEGAY